MVLKLINIQHPTLYIKELNNFKAELINLVRLREYRRISCNIQQQIKNDL